MNKNEYGKILECLQGTVNNEKRRKQSETFEIRNGKLYKKKKNGKILRVLKEDETDAILFMTHNHETGGHSGMDTTYNKIANRYYWKGMYNDTKKYIKCCDTCQRRGQKGGKSYLNPIEVGEPFERIGIDFVGPLERTKRRNRYILVVTDYLTKWPEAKAMKEATAENVMRFIYEGIICRHGCPKIILSDRGTHFRNKLVEGLCEKFKIKHKLSSPYHPQTNGLVERFNRTLCESLAKVSERENQWDEYLDKVLLKDAAKENQWSGKLAPKWKGPYYIHEEIGKGAYKLRTLNGKVLKTSHNVKHIKKYFEMKR